MIGIEFGLFPGTKWYQGVLQSYLLSSATLRPGLPDGSQLAAGTALLRKEIGLARRDRSTEPREHGQDVDRTSDVDRTQRILV